MKIFALKAQVLLTYSYNNFLSRVMHIINFSFNNNNNNNNNSYNHDYHSYQYFSANSNILGRLKGEVRRPSAQFYRADKNHPVLKAS
jgi:hypothetical protein